VAELAAGDTGAQTIVAYGNGVVFEIIGEVVTAFSHGTHKDADALVGLQSFDIVTHTNQLGVERQGHLSAFGREVVGDGILDHLEQLLLRIDGPDGQLMQQLDHQTSKSFEGTWNAYSGADLDQDSFCCMDVDLQSTSLVDRRVQQSEQALQRVVSDKVFSSGDE
jgi:hypothetical protein